MCRSAAACLRRNVAHRNISAHKLLILKYLQLNATFGWSLSNLVALLRMNLFAYRDLWA